jgi:hypothetical protein
MFSPHAVTGYTFAKSCVTHHHLLHTEAAEVLCLRDGWVSEHSNILLYHFSNANGTVIIIIIINVEPFPYFDNVALLIISLRFYP